MKKFIFATITAAAIAAVFYLKPASPIVNSADYEAFLTKKHLQKATEILNEQLQFWEAKLAAEPGNFVFQKKLAGLYAADFKTTGNVASLHRSDSLLRNVNTRIPGQVAVLQSLAANAITRHAFREAEAYMTAAFETGEKKFINSLMLTDVKLERGDFFGANYLLEDVASTSHFDYLIRRVKILDQQGDLEAAIETMETAAELARSSGNETTINWALSNLADMYGHDGRIEKSYRTYLEALSFNPAGLHSLKGIAWIAFSYDKNTAEARRILGFLQSVHPVPDYDLLLSEIAFFENKTAEAEAFEQSFIAKASDPAYGNMYKSYLCELMSEKTELAPDALAIAQAEIEERPHPMSYSLLAWASFQDGKKDEAVDILKKHVMEQTEEPVALYHSGVILKETGHEQEARKYLEAALDASFELGPVLKGEIESYLAQR
jgi:tetratricopeptide (TPR) repeat protein